MDIAVSLSAGILALRREISREEGYIKLGPVHSLGTEIRPSRAQRGGEKALGKESGECLKSELKLLSKRRGPYNSRRQKEDGSRAGGIKPQGGRNSQPVAPRR